MPLSPVNLMKLQASPEIRQSLESATNPDDIIAPALLLVIELPAPPPRQNRLLRRSPEEIEAIRAQESLQMEKITERLKNAGIKYDPLLNLGSIIIREPTRKQLESALEIDQVKSVMPDMPIELLEQKSRQR